MAKRLSGTNAAAVIHYVTVNVSERKQPFQRPEYAQLLLDELRFECDRDQGSLFAYVVMPEHAHFLIWLPSGNVSNFLRRFKPAVTLKLDAIAQREGRLKERSWLWRKGRRELWQDGKHSLPLWSEDWIQQKLDYIHMNPVRRELAEEPKDYPWSSYNAYLEESPGPVPVPVDTDWKRFTDGLSD